MNNTIVNDVNVVENEPEIVVENEVNEVPEELPDAGKEDTLLVVAIGLVAATAVYTYAKVKNYNV